MSNYIEDVIDDVIRGYYDEPRIWLPSGPADFLPEEIWVTLEDASW
ncbi:MAG: hypothetical protein JJE04_14885 [Acidobacteriia bacterium]|nr:hypothetical protein [Terriglobia bacterium]